MRIFFVVHSTSEDNEVGIASGHADPPLSPLGRRQAAELADVVRGFGVEFAAAYTSDLRRARETAAIALNGLAAPVFDDARLRECDYGTWTRRPATEVHAHVIEHLETRFPSGESYRDVVVRVHAALEAIASASVDQPVILVGHRAILHALRELCDGVALEDTTRAPFEWQAGWWFEWPRRG